MVRLADLVEGLTGRLAERDVEGGDGGADLDLGTDAEDGAGRADEATELAGIDVGAAFFPAVDAGDDAGEWLSGGMNQADIERRRRVNGVRAHEDLAFLRTVRARSKSARKAS